MVRLATHGSRHDPMNAPSRVQSGLGCPAHQSILATAVHERLVGPCDRLTDLDGRVHERWIAADARAAKHSDAIRFVGVHSVTIHGCHAGELEVDECAWE